MLHSRSHTAFSTHLKVQNIQLTLNQQTADQQLSVSVVAAQYVLDLVLNNSLDVSTSRSQVLTWIEVLWMLHEMLADAGSQGKAQVRVNVDLANCTTGSLAELILRNTDSIIQLAAVSVDDLYILRNYRRSTVEYDWELRQDLGDLVQNVETQLRWNQNAILVQGALCRSELECAVAGADSDSQGVNTGTGYELLNLLRMGVLGILCGYIYIILYACQLAKLALYYYAVSMSVLYYLLGNSDVVLEGMMGTVNHNGSETAVDAGLAGLKICTMIQMQGNWQLRMNLKSSLYQMYQILMVCILASTCGALQDYRSTQLSSSIGDTLYNLHVVYVECTDSVAALVCLLEHFFSSY